MAATTRFAAVVSALSILSGASASEFPGYPQCKPTTTTVYTTITVEEGWDVTAVAKPAWSASAAPAPKKPVKQQYSPPADFTHSGVTFPTYSPEHPNPNGPYYNPNDYIPEPITWPGIPKPGQTDVPDVPSVWPKPSGGYNAGDYGGPAWCPHGADLKPGLPQKDTNGDSKWGLIDCPRLPDYAGDDDVSSSAPYVSASATGDYGSKTWTVPTSAASYSAPVNGTKSWTGLDSSTASLPITSSKSLGVSSSKSSSASASSSAVPECNVNSKLACGKVPDTGRVRHYDFDVAYGVVAPDGVQRNAILVNGQFPGPLIEANWGDWIEVTVKNSLPEDAGDQGEPTAIHWHGFLQQETPYYDGVPSVMQGPLVPGKSVTYKFRADQYGTSWYHSHYSAQYAGGAIGPIVVYGPKTACYDEDIGPVMLSDWFHKDYFTLLKGQYNGVTALSNNGLINGKMNYPCDNTTAGCTPNAGVSKFQFTPGKKYRLRLLNTAADATMKFSIDGHNMTVFANDFKPVEPYTTDVVTLAVGQRSDIIVEATGKEGDAFWMRSEMGQFTSGNGCSFTTGVSTAAVAAVYYDGADTDAAPTTTTHLTDAVKKNCGNDDLSKTKAFCPVPLSDDFSLMKFTVGASNNGTHNVMHVNGSSFRADMNVNLLENVMEGNKTFAKEWNVYELDSSKKAVRMIFSNTHVTHHPMHLHGHDINVLAVGSGEWDGTITNPDSTQVRDVQMLKGAVPGTPNYIVVQFNLDNPGVWPFHCHIAWHVSAGLYINLLERTEDIRYTLPADIKQTTVDYAEWQARGNVVNQIDSGL